MPKNALVVTQFSGTVLRIIKKYTDKKENETFPHISGNSDGISCKVVYEVGLPNIVYEEMRKYLTIYED